MDKLVKTGRIVALALVMAIVLGIYGFALYDLQIVNGEEYLAKSAQTIVLNQTVRASRGSILDRNGEVLVSDKTIYNIKLLRSQLLKQPNPNEIVKRLLDVTLAHEVEYTDTFPVTSVGPFEYVGNMSSTQRSRLDAYFKYFKLKSDISASDLLVWMMNHYGIDYTYSLVDARRIIGVRYELEIRVIVNTSEYTFAKDVDVDYLSEVLEADIPFVYVETSTEREYHTPYAAHLLGYVGKMNEEESDYYSELGYPLDAYVGKSGIEKAFETYLHGTEGASKITMNPNGTVTNELVSIEAQPGNHVYLSLDIKLQEVAETALSDTITTINLSRSDEEEKASGGAIVAVDVNTGELLACASYPTYDLSTFLSNYAELSSDPSRPLFNRATQGTYNPGSTFKMVTAYAGLYSGKIGRYSEIEDKITYTRYEDYQPSCWYRPHSHGVLTVVGALKNSCNYFFYWLGDMMGIDIIAETAAKFGLGQPTGIEVAESVGAAASPEYKKKTLNEGWWAADTLLASIGQGHNYFTPIQIANYCATLANGGKLNKLTLLSAVKSADYSNVLYENMPQVNNIIVDDGNYISILQEGMREVVNGGTASSLFKNYRIPVAAKTGTVQSDKGTINTGVFICYAPADKPEIAVAVVVEKGGSGSSIMSAAKAVLDYYFQDNTVEADQSDENVILP